MRSGFSSPRQDMEAGSVYVESSILKSIPSVSLMRHERSRGVQGESVAIVGVAFLGGFERRPIAHSGCGINLKRAAAP
jgi:hypothetical protein